MKSFEEVMDLVRQERLYQDRKWGTLEENDQSFPGYLLVLEGELQEAREGWLKNKMGRDSALSEVLQIAAVAVACLQQYLPEN